MKNDSATVQHPTVSGQSAEPGPEAVPAGPPDGSAPASPRTQADLLRVLRGHPTPEELAAVTAVLRVVRAGSRPDPDERSPARDEPPAARWTTGTGRGGPGSWRTAPGS